LRQLETEGLVKVIPNKGPIVVVVSPEEAKNVYQVRAELEGLASRLFVEQASPPQVAELREAFGDLKRAYASGDAEAVLAAKAVFYDRLVEGAGNDILASMLRQLHSRAMLLRATSLSQPGRMVESEAEIGRMVDAIVRREAEAARIASITHVNRAAEVAIRLIEEEPES
jgi:DNA-binding GntR family transcriptional regulator